MVDSNEYFLVAGFVDQYYLAVISSPVRTWILPAPLVFSEALFRHSYISIYASMKILNGLSRGFGWEDRSPYFVVGLNDYPYS